MSKYVGIILFLIGMSLYGQKPATILKLSWSDANGLSYSELPEGRYGPQAFSVVDNEIYLLDNQNNRLLVYEDHRLLRSYTIPEGCYNLFVSEDHLLVSNSHQIYSIHDGKLIFSEDIRSPIHLIHQRENTLYIQDRKNQIKSINPLQKSATLSAEIFSTGNKVNAGMGRVHYANSNELRTFDISFPKNDLATIRVIAQDDSNLLYVVVERFVQQIPLEIERELRRYDKTGKLLNRVILPARGFALCTNNLYVSTDGRVYFLYTTRDDLQIIRFDLSGEAGQTIFFNPDSEFQNDDRSGFNMENETIESGFLKMASFPEVTPEEALETGDTYVRLNWTCTSDNLTDGLITDSYGNLVRTPAWVTAGTHENVVYKWGGFQTIEQFLNGLSDGKYAGDNYTTKGYGTPSAVGVDCSGFVSRCWNMPNHYSTRMMDDSITIAYDNWEDAKPGDAVHKEGHVRLVVENNPDGSITVVESAGYNWRVSYRTYTYAELYNYMPRYYINMQGTPGNVPQPKLASVLSGNEQLVSWSIGGTEVVSELKLYVSEDGENWDQSYTLDKNLLQYAWPDGLEGCQFFKMTSISNADQQESLPSDVYGAYGTDSDEKVLIVDGFDRTSSTSGNWSHIYHDFAVDYGSALFRLEVPFETVSNDAVLSGDVDLDDYHAVIWFVGDESTADETFNTSEQDLVINYLKRGGYLFITGSEIAWDLDYRGSTEDQHFFNNYFKADYIEDDSESYTVNGISETPFEGLSIHYDDGSHGVYEEDYPDVLAAINGSHEALRYTNGKLAAIYFDGLFPDGSAPGKLFYMGFPFETIYNENERLALMGAVMTFFEFTINSVETRRPGIAKEFDLIGNYPNPFNNSTHIRFKIPASGEIDLKIYNSLGEKIFEDRWIANLGVRKYNLNAESWASGVYFYRLGFNKKYFRTSRFVLLK